MHVKDIKVDEAVVAFSSDELAFLCSAINEALEIVENWEFRIRTGETPERAQQIMNELGSIREKMRRPL
jgi:hypothetical protein